MILRTTLRTEFVATTHRVYTPKSGLIAQEWIKDKSSLFGSLFVAKKYCFN